MAAVRITGLVKLADRVRIEIGRGVTPARKLDLQNVVRGAVAQVEEILQSHGAAAGQMPAPSRKAYQFLTGIKWEHVADSHDAPAPPPAHKLRWNGLGSFLDRLVGRLSHLPEQPEIDAVARSIEQMSARMESTISREGFGPESLTDITRSLRGWFAFMSEPQNLRRYTSAVALARSALEPLAAQANRQLPLLIEFRPMSHIYKFKSYQNATRIMLHTPMILFSRPEFEDLGRMMFPRDAHAKSRIVERMNAQDYAELMEEIETLGGVIDQSRGAFHDLGAVFDRVNAQFFQGRMPRPKLTWSRGFTHRKFGHYNHVRDWVMVSSTLDQAQVPAFVVEYLMFHELLHKKHGITWTNGRAMGHTSAFYSEERTFPRLAEAEDWLERLARG